MKRQFSVKTYLSLIFVEGIISVIILLMIPGDPKNVWVLGFSKFRLAMLVGGVIIVGVIGILIRKVFKDENTLKKIIHRVDVFFEWRGHITTGFVFSLAGFIAGCSFLFVTFTTTDQYWLAYYYRLAPWIFWLTLIFGQSLLFLILNNTQRWRTYFKSHKWALFVIIAILAAGFSIHNSFWGLDPKDWDQGSIFSYDGKFELKDQDIYAIYTEGDRLKQGENPYARVLKLGDDLRWNYANATYLPIFYYLAWLTHEVGVVDFIKWLSIWRLFFIAFNLGIAYLTFYIPYHRYNSIIFASFAALFWLFNRWTVHLTMIYHIDFIAIFFFLLSLATWPKHRIFSLLMFGLSLGVKQIAIFMIPVYLIWIWQSLEHNKIRDFIGYTLLMGSIPLIASMPFIIWNAGGFFKSILLSATRVSESHFGIPSIDTMLGLTGLPAKLPMLFLMALVFILSWKRKLSPFSSALFIMVIFVDFNSVLFRQYMTWVVPLIPLAVIHLIKSPPASISSQPT